MKRVRKEQHTILGMFYAGLVLTLYFLLNLKFVQVGIPDWIMTHLFPHLSQEELMFRVSTAMLTLGFSGFIGCLSAGYILNTFKLSFYPKMKLLTLLTGFLILLIHVSKMVTETCYMVWIVTFALLFGFICCIAYTLVFDLVRKDRRGAAGGIFTAIIYFSSASSPRTWRFATFREDSLVLMLAGYAVMLIFLFCRLLDPDKIEETRIEGRKYRMKPSAILILLFLVLVIDSFGFVRVVSEGGIQPGTQTILSLTWQNPEWTYRLLIGIAHAVSALTFGFLYNRLKPFGTLIISLAIFMVADLMIAVATFGAEDLAGIIDGFLNIKYIFPPFYASAVSIYTLVFFAAIADISDKDSINRNACVGMAVFGWFASYVSTGASLFIGTIVPFYAHLLSASVLAAMTLALAIYLLLSQVRGAVGIERRS